MIPPNRPNNPAPLNTPTGRAVNSTSNNATEKKTSFAKSISNAIKNKVGPSEAEKIRKTNEGIIKRNPGLIDTILKKFEPKFKALGFTEVEFKEFVKGASPLELSHSDDLDLAMETLCKKFIITHTMHAHVKIAGDFPQSSWNMVLANVDPAFDTVLNSSDSPMEALNTDNAFITTVAKSLHPYFPQEVEKFLSAF
ncbi:hypothetical protein [Variovorax sp. KK3]|uniref:hypothetical protein n=1 Tax=Variovorax sp. KK3 TaxID=1855728 RepID=UPI00117C0B85|nr:hypothetical protein [Variovorax sp. KK3]